MSALEGPLLWYLNRGTGTVTLVLFTATLVLGVLSLGGQPARGVPRFVTQALHRNLALLSFALLAAHVTSAVVDSYVDIRWWQAFVPVGATYEPLWLGLGAVALDLAVTIAVTSALRHRIRQPTWRLLHQLAWPMWVLSVAHGIGMGTDLRDGWWLVTAACVMAVPIAAVGRVWLALVHRSDEQPVPPTAETQPVRVLR